MNGDKIPPIRVSGHFHFAQNFDMLSHTRRTRSYNTRGGQRSGMTDTSERANKIRTQARTARELNAVARSWQPIDLHATKNSLLLEAVDIARLASNDLEGEFADKKKKRAGILALFKKNEEMVEDLMAHLEEVGDGVDVVACTDEKEYVEKLAQFETRRFVCFWAAQAAVRPQCSSSMFLSTDNSKTKNVNDGVSTLRQGAPLVDVESKKLLVVLSQSRDLEGKEREKVCT